MAMTMPGQKEMQLLLVCYDAEWIIIQGLVHAWDPPTVPNPPRGHDDHCGGNGSELLDTCAE